MGDWKQKLSHLCKQEGAAWDATEKALRAEWQTELRVELARALMPDWAAEDVAALVDAEEIDWHLYANPREQAECVLDALRDAV